MVNDNKIMKVVGRPKGTVKDPNRLKTIQMEEKLMLAEFNIRNI